MYVLSRGRYVLADMLHFEMLEYFGMHSARTVVVLPNLTVCCFVLKIEQDQNQLQLHQAIAAELLTVWAERSDSEVLREKVAFNVRP